MPYGCRMGICHTCTLTLVDGTVRDLRNGDVVRPEERPHPDLRQRPRRGLHARHLRPRRAHGDQRRRTEYAHLTPEEVEELGRELDAIRTEIEESRGDADAAYINRVITVQRAWPRPARVTLLASRWQPAWVAGTAMLGDRQDPREHGDRPQRHARPVGLDERPRDPLVDLGVGHRPAGRAVEAHPQLRAPPVHQRARPRQRHRLRHPADGPRAEVAPRQPRAAGLQHRSRAAVPVGRRAARPRPRGDPQAREGPEGDEEAAAPDRAEGTAPDRQGLRRLPGADAARTGRPRSPPTRRPT